MRQYREPLTGNRKRTLRAGAGLLAAALPHGLPAPYAGQGPAPRLLGQARTLNAPTADDFDVERLVPGFRPPFRPAAHRRETCRMCRDTFHPYRPAVRERIVGLPIRDIAVQTEGKARLVAA